MTKETIYDEVLMMLNARVDYKSITLAEVARRCEIGKSTIYEYFASKDEMIFNPVIGIDDRKGYFVHTSTYLVGRKPLETSSGDEDDYFSFLKPTKLKKQVREGLFLHNLEEDASGVGSNYLKFMADYYTKLGGFLGVGAPIQIVDALAESGVKDLTVICEVFVFLIQSADF